jgi:uncharacterized protein
MRPVETPASDMFRWDGERIVEILVRNGGVEIAVRVAPRASRDAIEGEYNGALKVRLTAPPVDDRANEALRRLLAERLKVPASAVRIVAGEKSRTKRVSISGVTRAQVAALFESKQ